MRKMIGTCEKIDFDFQNAMRKKGKYVIHYPYDRSEFEIQAFLYINLRLKGYDARGEVWSYNRDSKFDIVVFKKKKLDYLIEVKKKGTDEQNGPKRTRQLSKYRRYTSNIVKIFSMGQAKRYIKDLPQISKNEITMDNI